MLVLVSFGLVLLATILLVVGLLNDDGLTLINLSIASSITAAVVLFVAFRRARPQAESTATAPSPLAEDIAPSPVRAPEPERAPVAATAPTSVTPAVPPLEADEDDLAEDSEPSFAATAADAGWDDDEFPIADYDELKVGEIMPLLPQLYSDELEIVAERERTGKNRASILRKLAELAETGTEADAAEVAATETAAADEPAPVVAQPEPEPQEPAPAPAEEAVDDFEEVVDEYFFPIADYDELTVGQVLPLLPKLELDELEEVREREAAGAARKSLLSEIDRYLSGELEVEGYQEDDDVEPEPAPAAAKAPAPKKAAKKRAAAKKAPAKKRATKKKATKKAAGKKATKKKAASRGRFPIAKYDELTVADIRPRLTKLSDAQLEQVRAREAAGAGRKTILDDIDSRLS